jgi:arabinose-5-phosphate isomerase
MTLELEKIGLPANDEALELEATAIKQICIRGRHVIEVEAASISQLVSRIDTTFAKACQYLYHCEGRIITMGIGKSGHIARKLAATFASTGSPAFFIHPAEAKHGDMGMITKKDILLALSYSGETEEVLSLLPFIKRMSIPLITLTGQPNSTLAKAATININISVEKEACPLGLAPTSSTTAALVMGDALAMAVLDKRGFTENDFALSHPGGTLGRRLLLRISEIMHTGHDIPQVADNALLKEALVEMTRKKLGMTAVLNKESQLVGILTDGDIRRAFDSEADIHRTTVNEIMSRHPKTVHSHMLAAEALGIMEFFKITSLVVTNHHQHLLGIIHIHDILRAGII